METEERTEEPTEQPAPAEEGQVPTPPDEGLGESSEQGEKGAETSDDNE